MSNECFVKKVFESSGTSIFDGWGNNRPIAMNWRVFLVSSMAMWPAKLITWKRISFSQCHSSSWWATLTLYGALLMLTLRPRLVSGHFMRKKRLRCMYGSTPFLVSSIDSKKRLFIASRNSLWSHWCIYSHICCPTMSIWKKASRDLNSKAGDSIILSPGICQDNRVCPPKRKQRLHHSKEPSKIHQGLSAPYSHQNLLRFSSKLSICFHLSRCLHHLCPQLLNGNVISLINRWQERGDTYRYPWPHALWVRQLLNALSKLCPNARSPHYAPAANPPIQWKFPFHVNDGIWPHRETSLCVSHYSWNGNQFKSVAVSEISATKCNQGAVL